MKKNFLLKTVFPVEIVLFFGVLAYLVVSPEGSRFLARRLLQGTTSSDGYGIKEMNGSFSSGLVLSGVELRDAAFLPPGHVLRVQKAVITNPSASSSR